MATNISFQSFDTELANRLKRAVGFGDIAAVKRLLKGGVDINSATYWFDGSLLHEAVSAASPSIVRLLIDANADINAQSKDGRTPLHVACRSGQEDIVDMLLNAGAHVNIRTKDKRTALHIALWRGHESLGLKLIQQGANVSLKDEDGTTALHWAAKTHLQSCVEHLLLTGASANAKDKHGRTPLHEAVSSGANQRLIATLLTHGANPNIKPNITSVTSFTLALDQKETDTARVLDLFLLTGYRLTSVDDARYLRLSQQQRTSSNCSISDILETLRKHSTVVTQLSHLCRVIVRNLVIRHCRGQFVTDHVDRLPLPVLLRDYVAFRHDFVII